MVTSPAEDSTSVFVTKWMVPSTLFQLSCSSMKMLMVRECSLPTITANDCSLGELLSRPWTCSTVYNRCTPQPSEWTPARRAPPPWPTTWPPSPSPRMTGSPGRCSISSSRGPKGSSAGLQASYVVYICTVLVLLHYYC